MSDRRRTWLGLSTLCLIALLAVLIGLSVGYAIDPANPNRPAEPFSEFDSKVYLCLKLKAL